CTPTILPSASILNKTVIRCLPVNPFSFAIFLLKFLLINSVVLSVKHLFFSSLEARLSQPGKTGTCSITEKGTSTCSSTVTSSLPAYLNDSLTLKSFVATPTCHGLSLSVEKLTYSNSLSNPCFSSSVSSPSFAIIVAFKLSICSEIDSSFLER